MKKILALFLYLFIASAAFSQIVIVKDGKPLGRIIIDNSCKTDVEAANLLNNFISRISGTLLPVVGKGTVQKNGDIIIESLKGSGSDDNPSGIKEDGFSLSQKGSVLHITGGAGNGTIYGVVTLLEDYFGVHYFAANACSFVKSNNMLIPANINRTENPSFRYRQTQAYSILQDPLYKNWHRLEEPGEIFAGGLLGTYF